MGDVPRILNMYVLISSVVSGKFCSGYRCDGRKEKKFIVCVRLISDDLLLTYVFSMSRLLKQTDSKPKNVLLGMCLRELGGKGPNTWTQL